MNQKKPGKPSTPESSPFGYQLVDRKPKMGIVIAAVIGLVLFVVFFYFLGHSNTSH